MEIIVYTTPICPHCKNLKAFLNSKGVQYREVNLFEDDEAVKMLSDKGFETAPVISINGKLMPGFNEAELKKELGIN